MLNYKLQIKKVFIVVFVFSFLLSTIYYLPNIISAEPDCEHPSSGDIDYCINKINNEIKALSPANETNKKELSSLQSEINSLAKRIAGISNQLLVTEKDIAKRSEDLMFTEEIFKEKTKDHYKIIRLYDPIMPFLSSENAVSALREIIFRQRAANADIKTMEGVSSSLLKLRQDKEKFEKNKISMSQAKVKIDERAKFLAGEVAKTESYLGTLSAKQQELLAAKSGSFIASVGDSELADDPKASIKGFRDSAPSGSFAIFSFGGYTHRKGMSQYGARGRAQAGKNYSDILKAYYGKTPVNKDTSGTINAAGVGNVNFEDYYLMGIAEMPSSWNMEALKAQAVAARTYAYRYKVEGKQICVTEACQVFRKSKADNTPSEWKQAVQSTKGQVLEDVITYYSSTSGGYSTTSGWDTTDGAGGSSFFDRSYEKIGGSPWAYKAWYRQGYTSSGATCGESDPWLNNEEFTDIVNAAIVLKNGSDSRVTSRSTSCWGGNPYSLDEMKAKGGVSSVSSVVVSQGNGITNEVTINGTIHLTGTEFKQGFNLRAPGYLMIPQKGFAFFNIEKK